MDHKNKVLSIDVDWVTNYNQLITLISFLSKKFSKCSKIVFIESHHDILNCLEPQEDFIVNVDHHHDITQVPLEDKSYAQNIHMGNWVDYLIRNKKLNHYIWINNLNSNLSDFNLHPARNLKTLKIDHSLDFIDSMDFEKIVICKSFDYIPQHQKDMGLGLTYEVLKSIALNIFKEKVTLDNTLNSYKIY